MRCRQSLVDLLALRHQADPLRPAMDGKPMHQLGAQEQARRQAQGLGQAPRQGRQVGLGLQLAWLVLHRCQ